MLFPANLLASVLRKSEKPGDTTCKT